jgi:hypothetical protein
MAHLFDGERFYFIFLCMAVHIAVSGAYHLTSAERKQKGAQRELNSRPPLRAFSIVCLCDSSLFLFDGVRF